MPKFSIVIPVYNVENYLAECLDSVLAQTFKDFEVICVNDGSTDKSGEILKSYAQKDDRIKIIYKENGGLSSARNEGLKYVAGELCYFLDSDDYIESNLLEYAVKIFDNYEIDYFAFGSKVFVDGNVIQDIEKMQKYIDIKYDGLLDVTFNIARNCNIHVWNKIFKTEIIQKNKLNFIEGLLYEDIYFVWNYVFLSKKAYFEKGIFHNYRMRSSSIMEKATSNKTLKTGVDHMLNWYELFKKVLKNKELFKANYTNLNTLLKSYTNRTKEMVPEEDKYLVEKLKTKYTAEISSKKVAETQEQKKIEYKPIEKLFSVKITPDKNYKIIRFLCLKVRIKNKKVRSMQKYAKNKQKLIDSASFSLFTKSNNSNEQLINELKQFDNFKFLPNRGNLGDIAIACACYQLFDSLNLKYNVFNILNLKNETKKQFNLVYGGGGLFTCHYRKYYQEILEVFKSQNLKKAVILPASFYDCDDVLECFDERFIVFCREEQSFNYCKAKNNKAKFILANDMVLSLNTDFINTNLIDIKNIKQNQKKADRIRLFKLYQYYLDVISKYNRALSLSKNIGYFFRTDKECVKDIKKEIYSVIDLSLCANSFCADKAFSIILVKEFFKILDCYDYIVTDRLHIGICSMLLNKKVYLLDNSYKKVSNVMKNVINQNENLKIFENFDDILKELDNKEVTEIKHNKIEPLSFKDFLTEWLSVKNNFGAEKKYWGEIL